MNELALFAGAGGGLLGSRLLGWRTVCAVEKEPYRREVLLRQQRHGMLDLFPIWDDIRTFRLNNPDCHTLIATLRELDNLIVTAGFPCQPWSVAGKRQGEEDERNLWPDTIRVIREVGSRFAFLENVPGLLTHEYFGTILGDLAEAGYDAEWCVLGADDVGAPHRRKRIWILAHAQCNGGQAGRSPKPKSQGGRVFADETGQEILAYAQNRERPGRRSESRGTGEESATMADSDGEASRRDNIDRCGEDVAQPDKSRRRAEERNLHAGERDIARGGTDLADAQRTGSQGRAMQQADLAQKCATPKRGGTSWWLIDPADVPDAIGTEFKSGTGRRRVREGYQELANTEKTKRRGPAEEKNQRRRASETRGSGIQGTETEHRAAQPVLGRVAHGVAHRVDRLAALGDGQVPAVVRAAWRLLNDDR